MVTGWVPIGPITQPSASVRKALNFLLLEDVQYLTRYVLVFCP
jgi:hypothetical protein